MQRSQGGVWAVDVLHVPSQLLGPVQAGVTLQWPARQSLKQITKNPLPFSPPSHLVLGDYLALFIYCVIVKLWCLAILSAITM